jgi:hypothetical protein
MGMIGFAGHKPNRRAEERARAEAGLPDPLADVDERGRDFIYACRPKKLKEGMNKYNSPKIEKVEKALIEAVASKESGSFEVRRGHNMLTEVLGNLERRGRVRGMSSRMNSKAVESWENDNAKYWSRQSYKEGIYQKGYKEGVSQMISQSIQHAFTSNDPEMVNMRAQMLRQAGMALPPQPQGHTAPMIEGRPRHPIDDVQESTVVQLSVPFDRMRKITVANGAVFPAE